MKSESPRNAAVPTEMRITRTANEIACWRDGHVTWAISARVSLKYCVIFIGFVEFMANLICFY